MHVLDRFLNAITMYRLVLYSLAVVGGIAILFGFLGILSFNGFAMLASALLLMGSCCGSNWLFAKIFKAPRNSESALITALILFFVMAPPFEPADAITLLAVGVVSMLSKYILVWKRKHIFNPAAAGSFILMLAGSGLAFWWAGTPVLLPFFAIAGLMVVKKIRRFALFFSFLIPSAILIVTIGYLNAVAPFEIFSQAFTSWPLVFFGTYMLTEPLTTPPTRRLQILYGGLTGLLFASQLHVGPLTMSPELALLAGNFFSFLVSPRLKLKLRLKERLQVADGTYDFIFTPDQVVHFHPGQYLEWTLPHANVDSRGNRRYFTIASSPTEKELHLGVRIRESDASSFKKALLKLPPGGSMGASQLAGDFTLPADTSQKLVFIAGGIGITPFRSMVKYLLDTREQRDIVMFYACASADGFAYLDLFQQAADTLDFTLVPIVSTPPSDPHLWKGITGYITPELLKQTAPDYTQRTYYLSGPNAMVNSYRTMLLKLGISRKKIVTDYFPGF